MSRLLLLQDKLPLVTRIPLEDEVDLLTERKQLTLISKLRPLASDQALMVQYYPLEQMCETRHAALLTASYLYSLEEEGQLLGFDVNQEELYRFSQYYFLERLYSWLAVPFRGVRILRME